ncbi:MAG: translation elongation factor Ts [Saccharofermentans sp.]|jgi:elongation factor Ts|nr:translation elongation factor Ts [Mageeibacillus sp.]MCI1263419.1 translation elongation factor Ts [Saccharofermentans sp.]MCI1274872.1 translation elongation factor Ts [Saccharofermentans sp.]MCI1769089.1 translation elongation factor Ts [Mageeibacillus sp.]MCI2044098.1 translation elongation factor Ts [Mageeibacillus sp.]
MAVTAQQVKELRELTDCGIMDCKKALIASDCDIEKAKAWLREKGMAKAEKKSSRIAAEGAVISKISDDMKTGVLVEINIETDFAANTDKFKKFADNVATHIINRKPSDIQTLMAEPLFSDESKTVEVYQKETIADIGENTSIRRFVVYSISGNGAVASYIHMGGKIGVMVEIATGDDSVINTPAFADYAKNIGMQVAASSPLWIDESEVSKDELDKEIAIVRNKAIAEGKPEKVVDERIVPGQIKNFYKMNCLVDQEYFREESMDIKTYTASVAKELGTDLSVISFTRFALGEGIEKKEENFADEVRKQAGI